jgi:hypothetical protein
VCVPIGRKTNTFAEAFSGFKLQHHAAIAMYGSADIEDKIAGIVQEGGAQNLGGEGLAQVGLELNL